MNLGSLVLLNYASCYEVDPVALAYKYRRFIIQKNENQIIHYSIDCGGRWWQIDIFSNKKIYHSLDGPARIYQYAGYPIRCYYYIEGSHYEYNRWLKYKQDNNL